MKCPKCRHKNGRARSSARNAPRRLGRACSKCGRPLSPTAKFCPECDSLPSGIGKLYRRNGNRGQAQEHLAIATAMYREMDMAYWLEQAPAEMRQLG